MKSILIIGMGRFGRHLCKNLSQLGNQVMIVDEKEENLEEMLPYVVSAKIGDCTNENVLKSLGISNFDLCFVCIWNEFSKQSGNYQSGEGAGRPSCSQQGKPGHSCQVSSEKWRRRGNLSGSGYCGEAGCALQCKSCV